MTPGYRIRPTWLLNPCDAAPEVEMVLVLEGVPFVKGGELLG